MCLPPRRLAIVVLPRVTRSTELGVVADRADLGRLPPSDLPASRYFFVHGTNLGVFFDTALELYTHALRHLREDPPLWSTVCLLVDGDCTPAWNARFALALDPQSELRFTACLTTRHRRAFLLWPYRERLLADHPELLDPRREFDLAAAVVARYPRGYHLYKHLTWLVTTAPHAVAPSVFDWTETRVFADHNDFSALSLRLATLARLAHVETVRGAFVYRGADPAADAAGVAPHYVWACVLTLCMTGSSSLWHFESALFLLLRAVTSQLPRPAQPLAFADLLDALYAADRRLPVVSRRLTRRRSSRVSWRAPRCSRR